MLKATPKRQVLFVRRFIPVLLAVFGVFSCLTFTTLGAPKLAYATASGTVNFQARLQSNAGAIVADGNYNIEFKLYNASSSTGSSQGSCTGDSHCLWVEDYTGANVVTVKDGYFSVQLGSISAFPGTIDWSQQMYLTMNVGGVGTPSWNGEMNPRLALTATPYAFDAGAVGGLAASQLGQLAANQTWTGTNTFQDTSTTAFQVENNSSAILFGIDTSGNNVNIGATGSTAASSTVSIATSTGASQTVHIADGGTETSTVTLGSTNGTSATTVQGGSGGVGVQAASGGTISLGTTNTNVITIGNTGSTSALTLQGSGISQVITGTVSNPTDIVKGASTGLLQIQNSSGLNLLNVDTSGNSVNLGSTGTTALSSIVNIATSTGASQTIHIGDTNGEASTITIGSLSSTSTTTIQSGSGGVSIQAGANNVNIQTSVAGTVTIGNSSNGGLLVNNGATLDAAKSLGNVTTTYIGGSTNSAAAAATVDIYTGFTITQTSAGMSVSIPTPTITTAGRVIYIANLAASTQGITVGGITLAPGNDSEFLWNGSAWNATAVSTGVSIVGTFSSASIANGASISGNTITFGAADGTNSGMVTTGTQSFAGAKTFTGGVTVSGATLQADAGLSATGGTIALGTASSDTVTIGNSTSTNVITFQGDNISQKITGASSNPTDIIKGNSTGLFQVQSSSSSVFVVDTTDGTVGINTTPGTTYALNVNGVVNSNTGLDVNGVPVCTTACTPSAGSGNYIQNSTSFTTPSFGENMAVQTSSASSQVAIFRGASGQTADIFDVQTWNGTSATTVSSFNSKGDLAVSDPSLTTGNAASIATSSEVQTAGSVLSVSSNVTLDSGASSSFSGQLVSVSRNLIANKTGTAGGTPTLDNTGTYWQDANYSPDYGVRYTVNPGHSDYYLLVNVLDDNNSLTAPTSVFYGGAQMSLLGSTAFGGGTSPDMWLYGLKAPATGSHSLVINNTQGTTYQVTASSWYNVNQTTPYGSYAASKGSTGLPTRTATVTAGHVIVENMMAVVSAIPCNDAPSGTGQTLVVHNCENLYHDSVSTFDLGASYATATGGSQTLSWSGTSGGADGDAWATQWTDLIGDSGTTSVLGDNTTAGTADTANDHSGNYQCSLFTSSYSGTISSISAQFGSIDATYKLAQAAIYRASASEPGYTAQLGTLLGSSTTTTLANGANTFTLTASVTVSAGVSYWLCANSNVPLSATYYTKDTLLTNTTTSPAVESVVTARINNTFGTWPSGLGTVMDYSNGYQIYTTVTPLGSVGTGVSGAVATFSSNCTVTSGSCMDGSSVLQLTQQFTGATGAVLNIQNAGSGDMIDMVSGGASVAKFGNDGSLTFGGSLTGSTDVEWSNSTAATYNYPTYTVSTRAFGYALDYDPGAVSGTSYTTTFNITGLPDIDGTTAVIAILAQKTSGTGVVTAKLTINGSSALASAATPSTSSIENTHKNVTVTRIAGKWFVVGTYTYTNTSSSDPITAADYAEWVDYSGSTAPQPGEVLTVGDTATSVKDSSTPYDSHVIGVVSTNPYDVGGQDDGHSIIMALTGRVPVKVSLENGPIEPGDPLTSSSTPGVAMKATAAGQIIGTALEGYDGAQSSNEINVQLHPGYNNPQPGQIQGDAKIGGGLYVAGNANIEGDLTVAGTTTTQNLQVSGNASLAGLTVIGSISANSVTVAGQVSAATLAVSGNATFGGDVTVGGHFITAGTAPTTAVNVTDAGSTATCTVAGNDTSGTITLQSQGTGQASGAECTLTFNKPFGSAPRTVLSPNDSTSAAMGAYLQSTPTSMTLNFMGVPVTGQTYNYNYFAPQ